MTVLLLILLAAASGFLLGRYWRDPEPEPSPASSGLPMGELPAPVDAAALTNKLYELEAGFNAFGSNAAHPSALTAHPQFQEAMRLLADPNTPLDAVLRNAEGGNWGLACAALAALKERSGAEAVDRVVAMCDRLVPWSLFFALDLLCEVEPRVPVGAPLAGAKDWWVDNGFMPIFFRDYLASREAMGDTPTFGQSLKAAHASPHAVIQSFLKRVPHPFAEALMGELDTGAPPAAPASDLLSSLGRFWSDRQGLEIVVEPESWRPGLASAEATLSRAPPRSLLVAGEPFVGKTSFLRLLARRIATRGWSVFEAGGTDLMAGQIYIGQLEGRIREALEELKAEKKLIWYVPDLVQLAMSGRHQGQSASMLDQLIPAITAGRLVVWSEATPAAAARLTQLRPSLRSLIEVVKVEPQPAADSLSLVRSVVAEISDKAGVRMHADCAEVALESARQYLGASGLPGTALLMLKLTAAQAQDQEAEVTPRDVLRALAQLSGLPLSILDTRESIDLASIREFFRVRVIGQEEAVKALVERIAMLKAGLNDPDKPIGVFLFAGPTGTGKTELAKAVAEFLFGSVERLVRLDMSEFQTPESTAKIIGSASAPMEADSLIARVRKQPFSVLLLDEFEKAHPMVWDLFLQAFDEGRLTDAMGQVADLRHCLIILTSNLGATAHRSLGLGFAPQADAFTGEEILRAIAQTFRPEFQNRLDKVIVFKPLTRELMRGILKKELAALIERRGFRDRTWAVEWESSALEFLLEKGFSPEMGARPLKRAIEEHVVAPLAAIIVEKRFPEGEQFLFVRSDGRAVQAEFVDPDAEISVERPATEALPSPGLPAIVLAPAGSAKEFQALEARHEEIEQMLAAPEWLELKERLAGEMAAAGFWERRDRFETLARFALIDRVKAAAETASALRARLAKSARPSRGHSPELASRLALQLLLVGEGMRDASDGAPVEAALAMEPVLDTAQDRGRTLEWCGRLCSMYRAWGDKRRMQITELPVPGQPLPILLVSGFGAHRTLSPETGLHVFEPSEGSERVTARVRLASVPAGDVPAGRAPRHIQAALDAAPRSSAIVRRYRGNPPLVRSAHGKWRTGRLDLVLGGDFDLIRPGEAGA